MNIFSNLWLNKIVTINVLLFLYLVFEHLVEHWTMLNIWISQHAHLKSLIIPLIIYSFIWVAHVLQEITRYKTCFFIWSAKYLFHWPDSNQGENLLISSQFHWFPDDFSKCTSCSTLTYLCPCWRNVKIVQIKIHGTKKKDFGSKNYYNLHIPAFKIKSLEIGVYRVKVELNILKLIIPDIV